MPGPSKIPPRFLAISYAVMNLIFVISLTFVCAYGFMEIKENSKQIPMSSAHPLTFAILNFILTISNVFLLFGLIKKSPSLCNQWMYFEVTNFIFLMVYLYSIEIQGPESLKTRLLLYALVVVLFSEFKIPIWRAIEEHKREFQ